MHFSPGLLNMMRLALVMRRRKTVLFSLPSRASSAGHCLQVGRILWARRDLMRAWVQLSAQADLVVNSDQIAQAIVWLGPRAEVPQPPWAVVQVVPIVTSPHQARALFSCSSLPVLGAPHCSFLSSPSHGHWQAALWHTKAIVSPGWAGPFSSASPHRAISPALTVLQPFSEFVSACQHLSCAVGPKASVTQVVLDHI